MTIYRAAFRATLGDEDYFNIWHMAADGGLSEAIGDAFNSSVLPSYLALMSSAITVRDITVTDLTGLLQHTTPLTGSGARLGEMSAPQNAAVITLRTQQVGRRYRGRTYLIGLSEGDQASGMVTAGYKILMDTLAAAIVFAWGIGCGGNLALYHKDTETMSYITGYICRDVVYTQRRRTRGQGT